MTPTPVRFGWPTRLATVLLIGVLALLAYVYLQDYLSLRRESGNFWCPAHYGYPVEFDYIPRNSAERIAAGITDWWSWTRPGISCEFTDVVSKYSVQVSPSTSRSTVVAVLTAVLVVDAVLLLALIRRR